MGDVDLRSGFIVISKSRYIGEEATKTSGSDRAVKLIGSVVDVLKRVKPLSTTESDYVFLNQEGRPLNFHTWRAGVWYRILRGVEIKPRKPYCTRHTFISVGLTNGVNIKWLAEYCGTSVATIERHYGKYVKSDAAEQLDRLAGTVTQAVTPHEITHVSIGQGPSQVNQNKMLRGGNIGGPTWTRTRDQPVMSRWL